LPLPRSPRSRADGTSIQLPAMTIVSLASLVTLESYYFFFGEIFSVKRRPLALSSRADRGAGRDLRPAFLGLPASSV
jgi:hypothetical protein